MRFKACKKRKEKRNKWAALTFLTALILVISVLLMYKTLGIIRPSIDAIAEIKARDMIGSVINEATIKQINSGINTEELLSVKTNKDGTVEMVETNAIGMNKLATELNRQIKESYRQLKPIQVKVPLGTILGSQILSQTGPFVTLTVMPIGVSKVDFKSEFETQGINQTKYKIYIVLDSKVRVLAPFSSNTLIIKNTLLVAEAVILGRVPQNYVMVPKEELTNVIGGD